jgi:NAD-dependent SIR2 family protein deacetylase
MATAKAILDSVRPHLDLGDYRKKHWEGTFEEYLNIVIEHPEVTRTAYQRLYDMILAHGTEEVYENKEKIIRYKFFTEFATRHGDAIYGLDRALVQLERRGKLHTVQPNPGHHALVALEDRFDAESFALITQNVDGLHEAAGPADVVHIHGKLFESRCSDDCGKPAFSDHDVYPEGELPRCSCGALVRPNVCWFGEQSHHLDRIYHELELCDLFVAVGTSGSVQPVASFAAMLKRKPSPAKTLFPAE